MPSHEENYLGLNADPLKELELWVEHAKKIGDPYYNAMNLATTDGAGKPDSRMVLLKGIENDKIIFFTNYKSKKGQDLNQHPSVCLNFFWQTLGRQLRVHGVAQKISHERSEAYFHSRPRGSQISACASEQSQKISSRKMLEDLAGELSKKWEGQSIPCPAHWGGFEISATYFEFWLAHPERLHSRVSYEKVSEGWKRSWLAP